MKTESQGFEPWGPLTRPNGLANRRLKPLGQLSKLNGRHRNRTREAFTPDCFQDSSLDQPDAFQSFDESLPPERG